MMTSVTALARPHPPRPHSPRSHMHTALASPHPPRSHAPRSHVHTGPLVITLGETTVSKLYQTLILARSKITPKNVIRKDTIDKVNKKDVELNNATREPDEIKRQVHEYVETTKKKSEEDTKFMLSFRDPC